MQHELTDLNLAGYLVASGIPLQSNRTDNGKTVFCFNKTDKLLQLVDDYYDMKAMINPMQYGAALKMLKNMIYQKNSNYTYDNHARRAR